MKGISMKQFNDGSRDWGYEVKHGEGEVAITVYNGDKIDAVFSSPWLTEKGLLDYVIDTYGDPSIDTRLGLGLTD